MRINAWVFELVTVCERVRRGWDYRRVDSGDGDISRGFGVSVSRAVVFCVGVDTVSGDASDWVREAFGEENTNKRGEKNDGEERAKTRAEDCARDEASEWVCGE